MDVKKFEDFLIDKGYTKVVKTSSGYVPPSGFFNDHKDYMYRKAGCKNLMFYDGKLVTDFHHSRGDVHYYASYQKDIQEIFRKYSFDEIIDRYESNKMFEL